jgi:hypothetical protein
MTTPSSVAGDTRSDGIRVIVRDNGRPVRGATCRLYGPVPAAAAPAAGAAPKKGAAVSSWTYGPQHLVATEITDRDGVCVFKDQAPGTYLATCLHGPAREPERVKMEPGCLHEACIELGVNFSFTAQLLNDDCTPNRCGQVHPGDKIQLHADFDDSTAPSPRVKLLFSGARPDPTDPRRTWLWTAPGAGSFRLAAELLVPASAGTSAQEQIGDASVDDSDTVDSTQLPVQPVSGNLGVALSRTATEPTTDTAFFRALLNSTEGLSFNTYLRYMDNLFCGEPVGNDIPDFEKTRINQKKTQFSDVLRPLRLLPFTDSDAYRVIKAATEAFVMINCGVLGGTRPFDTVRDNAYLQRRDLPAQDLPSVFTNQYLVPFLGGNSGDKTLPYLAVIRSKLPDIAIKFSPLEAAPEQVSECTGILQDKLTNPCLLELIWSYWHEEGMLAQTMNAITRRFQNVRSHERDPLANLEIDPLRPLNNVLWGFVQDEQHRLSVVRRNYEYDHHYGLRLEGKAVQRMQTADSRSRFLEAFHHLLRLCAVFFKQDDDTTVKADAFPVLNALKEVHLILSQGAHNQFGDLPSTARIEMLMQQWMLARPEFREFLPTRIMTAYPEPWMDRVDAMKKLQGWTDTSVLHFRNLAIFGEQVLLTIRWGHWSDVQEPLQAFNWARLLRPQIQGYSHAYRAVTGVDLAADVVDIKVDATLPSVLLQRRLAMQQRSA